MSDYDRLMHALDAYYSHEKPDYHGGYHRHHHRHGDDDDDDHDHGDDHDDHDWGESEDEGSIYGGAEMDDGSDVKSLKGIISFITDYLKEIKDINIS